jgi:hypothetical protein
VHIDYTGDHDMFLGVAEKANLEFIGGVEGGNFTAELRRLAVASEVFLLHNVSSSSLTILDFDHYYNSKSPTVGPTPYPPKVEFYKKSWFTITVIILLICCLVTVLFSLGLNFKIIFRFIHKICFEAKIDDKYVESSSESDPDDSDNEVYKYKVDPNITDVDDMY